MTPYTVGGFIVKCASEGCSEQQTAQLVKVAFGEEILKAWQGLTPEVQNAILGGAGGAGIGAIGGGLAGGGKGALMGGLGGAAVGAGGGYAGTKYGPQGVGQGFDFVKNHLGLGGATPPTPSK